MARVDPEDDGVTRFGVRRYSYDVTRHERRHQVIAAFDNEAEFADLINQLSEELRKRADCDPRERISGVVVEAGHTRRWANARLISSAMKHGVTPPPKIWNRASADLPPGVSVWHADVPDT